MGTFCGKTQIEYDVNEFAYSSKRDQLLDLISEFFDYSIDELGDVIQMALEYTRRRPAIAPQLVWSINEHFGFTPEDYRCGFVRQTILLDTISNSMNTGDNLALVLFWKIIDVLLKCEHHCVKGAFRNPQKFVIYNLSICESKPLTELHKSIWTLINRYFDKESFSSFIGNHGFYAPKGSRFPKLDAYAAGEIIVQHLSPKDLEDCLIANKFIKSIEFIRSCNPLRKSLVDRYNNNLFDFYNHLRWNYCQGKEESNYDYIKYRDLKMKELIAVFKFDTQKDCSDFIRKFRRLIVSREIQNKESLYQSVGFLIGHTLRTNISLGTYLLRKILRDITDLFDISPILYPLTYDEKHNWADAIYAVRNVLQTTKNQNKPRLLIGYYTVVPGKYLATDDLYVVLESIREYKSSERIFISPSQLTKFDIVSKDGFTSVMKEIYCSNQSEFRFHLESYDTETWFELIADNNIAELIYLQQAKYQDHFDFKRKAFLNMINRRPQFLADYVKVAKPRHSPKITEVWSITGIETIIEEILSRISPHDCLRQYIDRDWEYELFSEIKNKEGRKKVETFITERFMQKRNLDQTFRLARLFSIELFNQLAVKYIDIAASADEYMEIDWINSSSSIVAVNQTTGEIVSQRWQVFMDIVNTSMSTRKYSIIAKIKQLIQRANESSFKEKEREKLYN